jgi:hypothetical protein
LLSRFLGGRFSGSEIDGDGKLYLVGSSVVFFVEMALGTPLVLALFSAFFSWGWLLYHIIIFLLTGETNVFYRPQQS